MNDNDKILEIRFGYSKTDELENIKFLVRNNEVETFLSEVNNNGLNLIKHIDMVCGGETNLEEFPDFQIQLINIFESSKYDWIGNGSFEQEEGINIILRTDVHDYIANE